MIISIRKNHELRLRAFDLMTKLKINNSPQKEVIDKIMVEFGVPKGTLYGWYLNGKPHGRKGKITTNPELFYVLGALLGDGCLYNWKITNNYVILVGDNKFATKYADMVSECSGKKAKAYIDRSKNIWFVKSNNFELYSIFKKIREDLDYLRELIRQNGKKSALLFVEGFFDAEGCVKIIKEKVRKTPKICLDITNTNQGFLEIVRILLKENLDIEAHYSNQEAYLSKDGSPKKKAYHLRIYKKEYVKRFFENISTTKLKDEKMDYLTNWLNNGK